MGQPGFRQGRTRRQQALRRLLRPAWPGMLRRTTPISDVYGYDRGTPVDRAYIEHFLAAHRADIRGRVLEVQDDAYTRRFGGTAVTHSDVLDIDPANPHATIVADLSTADQVPSDSFDCFILTQTLQYIYDVPGAIGHARRLLCPGGVLLATLPALGRIGHTAGVEGDFWRFTVASAARLFGDCFGPENVHVRAYGNVLAGLASLTGLAVEDLTARQLAIYDDRFPLIVAVRACKV